MFQLPTYLEAILRTLTPRIERHGEDEVSALSLGLRLTGANTLLDHLQPGLRTTLYEAVEGQEDLPGVEPATPLLRTKGIESVKLTACYTGWTFYIDRGVDESTPIALGDAKIDAFVVYPHEGGTVDIDFRVGSSDIDGDEAGWLFSQLKQPIFVRASAPKKADGAVIDGTVGHPGLAAQRAAEEAGQGSLLDEDAGDAFARLSEDPGEGDPEEQDADGAGAGDPPDDEGAAPDVASNAKRRRPLASAEVH